MRAEREVLQEKLSRYRVQIAEVYRDRGLAPAAVHSCRLMRNIAVGRWLACREYYVDRRLRIDSRGITHLAPQTVSSTAHGDSLSYQATSARDFERLVSSLPIASPAHFTFIDLGCGKGRVLLLAAKAGFTRVIGVDIDDDLLAAARVNTHAFQKRKNGAGPRVELVRADAAEYQLPATPLLIYLYNPFGEQTLRAVVENIERSWRDQPRAVVVAYLHPVHQHVLDESPALRRLPNGDETWWSFFEAAPPLPAD